MKNIKSDINYLVVYLKCKQELFQERRARNKTDGNGIITTPSAYLLSGISFIWLKDVLLTCIKGATRNVKALRGMLRRCTINMNYGETRPFPA